MVAHSNMLNNKWMIPPNCLTCEIRKSQLIPPGLPARESVADPLLLCKKKKGHNARLGEKEARSSSHVVLSCQGFTQNRDLLCSADDWTQYWNRAMVVGSVHFHFFGFSWREKKWLSGLEQDGAGSAGKLRREDAAITIYYFRVLPSTDELLIPWQVFEFIFSSISQERRRQIFADFPAKHLHTIQNMKFLSFIILIPFPFHSLGNPLISPIFCIQLFNIV